MADRPKLTEERLRRLYWENGLSTVEIGEKLGYSRDGILGAMKRHGVERRDRMDVISGSDAPYADADVLRELYHGQKMPTTEIAEEFGCHHATISRAMDRLGVEKRELRDAARLAQLDQLPQFRTAGRGYERVRTRYNRSQQTVAIHRLAAVAWFGLESVKDNHIHHKNNIPWDNRQVNLQPIDPTEHRRMHGANDYSPTEVGR